MIWWDQLPIGYQVLIALFMAQLYGAFHGYYLFRILHRDKFKK